MHSQLSTRPTHISKFNACYASKKRIFMFILFYLLCVCVRVCVHVHVRVRVRLRVNVCISRLLLKFNVVDFLILRNKENQL